jgi:hypothetical protein
LSPVAPAITGILAVESTSATCCFVRDCRREQSLRRPEMAQDRMLDRFSILERKNDVVMQLEQN